ncbi:VP1 [Avian gyrovirus 13]|uniref:Capsid protein n=1 Tax=Avian gyrovirus 13 TaxID=2781374 RepID=A0A7M1I6K9_9VIRU|nr:VP1 [Avian gyrovirus 13]
MVRRRATGRIYRFRRGRWRHRRRFPRKRRFHRRRRYKKRHYSFRKRFKNAFFNSHPGSYVVRLKNPYNIQHVLFQGIIFVPDPIYVTDITKENQFMTCTRTAKITISLYKLWRAVMNLDQDGKIGGPMPIGCKNYWMDPNDPIWQKSNKGIWPWSNQYNPNKSGAVPASQDKNYWFDNIETKNVQAGATRSHWWNWALMLVHPIDPQRLQRCPGPLTIKELFERFGGYQLFRHRKTKVSLAAVSPSSATDTWSPVASIAVQDNYFELQGEIQKGWTTGATPYTGARFVPGKGTSKFMADETIPPAQPPPWIDPDTDHTKWNLSTLPHKAQAMYSNEKFLSFAAISALGGQWSFPPPQKPVSHASFSHHTINGSNDPQGRRWMTLFPRETLNTPESIPDNSDFNKNIATIYMAQGGSQCVPWRFGTATVNPLTQPFQSKYWAVLKIKSWWTLGNSRRPWPWDVNTAILTQLRE